LAESTAPAIKTSRRDLPHVISQVCTWAGKDIAEFCLGFSECFQQGWT
jgi:hypothetical protein